MTPSHLQRVPILPVRQQGEGASLFIPHLGARGRGAKQASVANNASSSLLRPGTAAPPSPLPFPAPITPSPQAREERHPGTSHATPVAAVPLPRTARFPGPCTPAFPPAGRTAAGPGPASCAPPAARPDPLPRPRGSSPACPGRIGAGTRAARRTAPTPARAAPRWWLCGKRPRWCASGSRRWCGPGSTSRRGEQGSRPPLSNPALGPPRPARPGSAPAASPGRLRFSARGASANARADEDGRGQPRDRPPGRGGRKPDPPAPRAASASQRGTGHVSAAPSVYL